MDMALHFEYAVVSRVDDAGTILGGFQLCFAGHRMHVRGHSAAGAFRVGGERDGVALDGYSADLFGSGVRGTHASEHDE